jgi:hypothetical protein
MPLSRSPAIQELLVAPMSPHPAFATSARHSDSNSVIWSTNNIKDRSEISTGGLFNLDQLSRKCAYWYVPKELVGIKDQIEKTKQVPTRSMAWMRRRHMPCRRYWNRVPIKGISANTAPWTLQMQQHVHIRAATPMLSMWPCTSISHIQD